VTPEEVDFRIAASFRRVIEAWQVRGFDPDQEIVDLETAILDEIRWLES